MIPRLRTYLHGGGGRPRPPHCPVCGAWADPATNTMMAKNFPGVGTKLRLDCLRGYVGVGYFPIGGARWVRALQSNTGSGRTEGEASTRRSPFYGELWVVPHNPAEAGRRGTAPPNVSAVRR